MCWRKHIVTFFSDFSRGDIIATLGCVGTILFIVWWDKRRTIANKINIFIVSLCELKTIIETKTIPEREDCKTFFGDLFIKQDGAMSVIRSNLKDSTKTTFDKMWAEYKNARDPYKNYRDTDLKGKFSIHKRSGQLISLIDELIKIANKT